LNEVQQMINMSVLKYLMNLAVNDKSFMQTKALARHTLNNVASFYRSDKKNTYALQYLKELEQFNKKPELFKLKPVPNIPDGSPIGSTLCNFN